MGFRVLSKEEGFGGEIAAFLMGAQNVTEICFMRASLVCLYVDRRWRRKRVFGGVRAEAPASRDICVLVSRHDGRWWIPDCFRSLFGFSRAPFRCALALTYSNPRAKG